MINREIKTILVKYFDGLDQYGQQLATKTAEKEITATFGLLNQSNTTNANYLDATHYLLTKDHTINDKCKVPYAVLTNQTFEEEHRHEETR